MDEFVGRSRGRGARWKPAVAAMMVAASAATFGAVGAGQAHAGSTRTALNTTIDGKCNTQADLTLNQLVDVAGDAAKRRAPKSFAGYIGSSVTSLKSELRRIHINEVFVPNANQDDHVALERGANATAVAIANGLDKIRQGQQRYSVDVGTLTVDQAIDLTVTMLDLVRVPLVVGTKTLAGDAGSILNYGFKGSMYLHRTVRDKLGEKCSGLPAPAPARTHNEPVDVPQSVVDVANTVTVSNQVCTTVGQMTLTQVVNRTVDYIRPSVPKQYLGQFDNRTAQLRRELKTRPISTLLLPPQAEDLGGAAGSVVGLFDDPKITTIYWAFLRSAQGKGNLTIPVGQMTSQNALDLTMLAAEIAESLTSFVWEGVTTPASSAGVPVPDPVPALFAGADYGLPIYKGVIKSLCLVA